LVIRITVELLLVNVPESSVFGVGGGQGFGLQVPFAVKLPAHPVEIVTEQVPFAAQQEPVVVVVGQLEAAMTGTKTATITRRTNHLIPLPDASDINDLSFGFSEHRRPAISIVV
jgi:hypothetical protein